MAIIRLHTDALNPQRSEAVVVGAVSLLPWLRENAPWADVVVRNGRQLESLTDIELCELDSVDVFKVPHTGLEWYWIAAIAVGATIVSYALMPKPDLPNGAGEAKESPNNRLNAATNTFRPRQAMPHIYGEVRAYPDFIQPSYYVYEDNLKRIREVFLVGNRYCGVSSVKSGDTELDDYVVYQPGDTLPQFYDVRSTNEVDGQEIEPADKSATSVALWGGIVTGTDTIENIDIGVLNLSPSDTVTITGMTWNNGAETFSGTATVASLGANSITFSDVAWVNSNVTDGEIMSGTLVQDNAPEADNWFTLSGGSIEAARAHVVSPQGLYSQSSGEGVSVQLRFDVQALDATGTPVGAIIERTFFISGDGQASQYRTFEIGNLAPGSYRARVVRVTNKIANAVDALQLEGLDSVTPIDTSKYGEVTLLATNRIATENATSGRSSKINCIAQALLPIFDPNTGTFGARAATRSAAQAVMDVLMLAGESLDNINYQRLFDVVPSNELGYFDFTFDDADISVGQAIETILNAARCYHWLYGDKYEFNRDEAKPVRSALFNRRNTLPEASEQSYTFYRNHEYDSVELEYVDPVTNNQAYLRRRINPTTGAIENGLGVSVNEIKLAGCRSLGQALNRVELEIRKIKYLWLQVKDTVTSEGLLVGLGDRVGWCDINDSDVFSGEILADLGSGTYRLSEPWTPQAGVTYYAYAVQSDGTVSTQAVVTQPAGEPYQMSVSGLSALVADGYDVQQGSLYVIAPEGGIESNDFTVVSRSKPNDSYNVELELVNYDERVYERDSDPLPTELTVTASSVTGQVDNPNCVSVQSTASVTVTGAVAPVSYQWQKVSGSGVIVSGGNTDTATITFSSVCADETDVGAYRCVVTDGGGRKASAIVEVQAVNSATPITDLTVTATGLSDTAASPSCITLTADLLASASGGTPPYTYLWERLSGDGTLLSTTDDGVQVEFDSVCPSVTKSGTFKVTVTDSLSATASDEVTVSGTNTQAAVVEDYSWTPAIYLDSVENGLDKSKGFDVSVGSGGQIDFLAHVLESDTVQQSWTTPTALFTSGSGETLHSWAGGVASDYEVEISTVLSGSPVTLSGWLVSGTYAGNELGSASVVLTLPGQAFSVDVSITSTYTPTGEKRTGTLTLSLF